MIVFDMDGTLSLVGDRKKFLDETPKNWDAFFTACGEDKPNKPIVQLFKMFRRNGRYVKIVTGRDEKYREVTLNWLFKNGMHLPSNDLHMRSVGDPRQDSIIKQELIIPFRPLIKLAFEDRSSVVAMWRSLGILCCQVADGDF